MSWPENTSMKGKCGLYPSLGRYFATKEELADAGCMSRQRLDDCLNGKKQFTDQEKVAIANYIELKKYKRMISGADLFDDQFRIKGA